MAFGSHAPSVRAQKVSKILKKFDLNQDGHLNRDEMAALVVAVNPRVPFTEDQIEVILDEVFRTYADYIDGDQGLSYDGLLQTYNDGAGDIDRDFKQLELEMDNEAQTNGKEAAASTFLPDERYSSSRRKKGFGSWAGSPKNGITYEDTWGLIEELETLIRRLESKMEKKGRANICAGDPCTASTGWVRNQEAGDGSSSSQVAICKRAWEELGQDYSQFQRGLNDIRRKADPSRTQEEAFDAHMAIGRTLFDHSLYKEALVSFSRAREIKPTDVRPHFQEGNTLYALGKPSEAKESYIAALKAAERDEDHWGNVLPQVHVNLGIAYEAEGMLLNASEHYKEAVIKEPKHFRALKLLGSALYGVGEYAAAKVALDEAVLLNDGYADAHCELGSVLHVLGDHDNAILEFQKALEIKSNHLEAQYNLATLYKDTGQYRRAAATYNKVLSLQPTNWRAQLNKAVSLLGAGDIDESKRAFKEAYKMTGRAELHDAILHLRNLGTDEFGRIPEGNFIVVDAARFKIESGNTTTRTLLAYGLNIRQFQKTTRFNRCNITSLTKELQQMASAFHIGTSEKLIRKADLETITRRLLHFLKPEAFLGAMKAINEKILAVLDSSGSGKVDIGMAFAILALICSGPVYKRKHTAFDALVFHSSRNITAGEISKADIRNYMNILQVVFQPSNEQSNLEESGRDDGANLSFPEFSDMLDDPKQGFGVVNVLVKLEEEDHSRHGQSCSVCKYPIVGSRFKETKLNFSLCSLCYSSGKVPSNAKHAKSYYFKEFSSELAVIKDKLNLPFTSCLEL